MLCAECTECLHVDIRVCYGYSRYVSMDINYSIQVYNVATCTVLLYVSNKPVYTLAPKCTVCMEGRSRCRGGGEGGGGEVLVFTFCSEEQCNPICSGFVGLPPVAISKREYWLEKRSRFAYTRSYAMCTSIPPKSLFTNFINNQTCTSPCGVHNHLLHTTTHMNIWWTYVHVSTWPDDPNRAVLTLPV